MHRITGRAFFDQLNYERLLYLAVALCKGELPTLFFVSSRVLIFPNWSVTHHKEKKGPSVAQGYGGQGGRNGHAERLFFFYLQTGIAPAGG